jgi:DnaK suppressor protein
MKTKTKRRPAVKAGARKTAAKRRAAAPKRAKRADRWHWHRLALAALRERLADEARELRSASAGPLNSEVGDFADAAEGRSGRELIEAELRTEEGLLEEVDAALARLAAGTYGICEATGRAILPSRLRAIPWTRFNRVAAERRERP